MKLIHCSSSAAEPEPCAPAVPFPIQKVQMDEREEFGPRLPPVFCPNTRQKLETPQKEKPKKSKEKHKTKKEHRRKKEKKKKHKKHKHKSKQRNKKSEKSSSSESDGSDSGSDEGAMADLCPQELLRRLKSLPLRRQ
ncbi:hypothetical protein ACRRTK_000463 [Alexandromys fortis]